MQRISSKTWQKSGFGEPLFLCQLPQTVSELENQLQLKFESRKQGSTYLRTLFVNLDGQQLCLLSASGRTVKEIGVRVHMHGNESDPNDLLDKLLNALALPRRKLARIGKYMTAPKYILMRQDGNNHLEEVTRLHDQTSASRLLQQLTDKARKESYFVEIKEE